jgi:signal transduction histidine kinase
MTSTATSTIRPTVHDLLRALDPRSNLSIRLGLVAGGIALLSSLLFTIIFSQRALQTSEIERGQAFAELAFQMTDKLDRGMFERYREIQIMASLDVMRNPTASAAEKRQLLELLQTTYDTYAWIGLTDTDGLVVASTGGLLEGADVSQRPWFANSVNGPFAGDVHEAVLLAQLLPSIGNEPPRFVDVAVPVYNYQGQFVGVLGAHLSWTWASEVRASVLTPLRDRSEIEMLVLSADGTVLLGSAGLQLDSLSALSAAQRAAAGQAGYIIERWPDGINYLTGYAYSAGFRDYPGLGWSVLVRQPSAQAFASAYQTGRTTLAWGVGFGIISMIAVWGGARSVVRPLITLSLAAEQKRLHQSPEPIPLILGQDEVASLSLSLYQLVRTIENNVSELEARVAERTEALTQTHQQRLRFMSMLSHEFRTPLALISSAADLIAQYHDRMTPERRNQHLAQIQAQVMRLTHFLDDILMLSRSEAVGMAIELQPTDLTALCAAVVAEMQQTSRQHLLEFTVTGEPELIEADGVLLSQGIANLISNAIKYSPAGGTVRIGLTYAHQEISLTVQDYGIGIPAADQTRLFQDFQRGSNVGGINGTGLGLTIVKRTAEVHGGRVSVASAEGVGTTFTLMLPHGPEAETSGQLSA